MANNKLIKQLRLRVKTELKALKEVLHLFERSIDPLIPKNLSWQCEVALSEAFTNAVRHAHQDLPITTPIDIEVKLFANWLEMRVWDWGEPFDLIAQIENSNENYDRSLDREGGRGLRLMDKLTDEVYYFRLKNQQNCLLMRKQINQN